MIIIEFLLLIIFLFFIYLWVNWRQKDKLKIYFIEYSMKIDSPIPICGTPDVVWIDRKERLIVGDYKSRYNGKIFDSDIIQLSVYRLLLEQTQRKKVAEFGFIHFKNGQKVKVNLLSKDEVIKLYKRYQGITDGTIEPRCTKNPTYCQYCRYAGSCD